MTSVPMETLERPNFYERMEIYQTNDPHGAHIELTKAWTICKSTRLEAIATRVVHVSSLSLSRRKIS